MTLGSLLFSVALLWLVAVAPAAALASDASAANASDASAGSSPDGGVGAPKPSSETIARPLSETSSPWYAFAIGGVGSLAYLIAIWVGLVGSKDGKPSPLLNNFSTTTWAKVPLYVASGGAVAMVFQFTEAHLVPVQAFIIGCTWPAVVSNYLSGRQSGEMLGVPIAAGAAADLVAAQGIKNDLPKVTPPTAVTNQLDEIINAVTSRKSTGPSSSGDAPPPAPVPPVAPPAAPPAASVPPAPPAAPAASPAASVPPSPPEGGKGS